MQVLAVGATELPLAAEFHPVASAVGDTCQTIPRSFFLGSATGLPPPAPSASSLSLGFYKIHCTRETQSCTEWQISCLVFVMCVHYSRGP
jgi:hypothetical protein